MNHLLSALMPTHAAVTQAIAEHKSHPSHPSYLSHRCDLVADLILGKYIIVDRDGHEVPILFSRDLQHSEVLSPKAGRPVAAGFYQFFAPDKVLVSGESSTLSLRSRPIDATIIRRHLLFVP